jgi:Asp-tRNA(Asn)/Glu-tRNA(Gln) amidotransferase A subunit family amidase
MAWWRGPGLFVQQVLFPGSWKASQTSIYARSIADAVRALEAAAKLEPGLAVQVGSTPMKERRPTKKQRAQAPTLESWASTPGAKRYRHGTEAAYTTGAVWVLEKRGSYTIQQYRVYVNEDGEELLAWDTFTASGGISRDMEER